MRYFHSAKLAQASLSTHRQEVDPQTAYTAGCNILWDSKGRMVHWLGRTNKHRYRKHQGNTFEDYRVSQGIKGVD